MRTAPIAGVVVALTSIAAAQEERQRIEGFVHDESLGIALALLPDRTGDGVPELLAGAPGGSNDSVYPSPFGGHVRVLSGADLSLVLEIHGGAGGDSWDEFGAALATFGDFDGDGIEDFLIGAPDAGRVTLHSGSDGREIARYTTSGGGRFGESLAVLGDVDGDGVNDLAIGAPQLTGAPGKIGVVEGRSGATGALLFKFVTTVSSRQVGGRERIATLGDLDGDGASDLAVADVEKVSGADRSVVRVLSGRDGHELSAFRFDNGDYADDTVRAIAPAGDFDGDGAPDLLVATSSVGGVEPAIYIFSGATGAELVRGAGLFFIAPDWMTVRMAGDVDSDGTPDFLVAERIPGITGGIQLLSGATGELLVRVPLTGESGGYSMVVGGDFDGDGSADLAFGNPFPPFYDYDAPNDGYVNTFSWLTNSGIATLPGAEQIFRIEVATRVVGDVDGDGDADFVTLRKWRPDPENFYFAYEAELRSGRDGALLSSQPIPHRFHSTVSIASLPDLDADGIDDYVAAFDPFPAPNAAELRSAVDGRALMTLATTTSSFGNNATLAVGIEPSGSVRVAIADHASDIGKVDAGVVNFFDAATGALLVQLAGDWTSEALGKSLAFLGDITGDGVGDWALGAPSNGKNGANAGRVVLIDGAGWTVLRVAHGVTGEKLGSQLATLSDLDGDGAPDFAVASPSAASGKGSITVLSSATLATLATVTGASNAKFGTFLTATGDLNGDGAIDWAAGNSDGKKVELRDGRTATLLARFDSTDHFEPALFGLVGAATWAGGFARSGRAPDLVIEDKGAHGVGGLGFFTFGDLLTQIEPPDAYPSETVFAYVRGGPAGQATALGLIAIDGLPTSLLLDFGAFDAQGEWFTCGSVPSGLSGLTWTLRGYAIGWNGELVESADQELRFK